jgi:hypothetical protein
LKTVCGQWVVVFLVIRRTVYALLVTRGSLK